MKGKKGEEVEGKAFFKDVSFELCRRKRLTLLANLLLYFIFHLAYFCRLEQEFRYETHLLSHHQRAFSFLSLSPSLSLIAISLAAAEHQSSDSPSLANY